MDIKSTSAVATAGSSTNPAQGALRPLPVVIGAIIGLLVLGVAAYFIL